MIQGTEQQVFDDEQSFDSLDYDDMSFCIGDEEGFVESESVCDSDISVTDSEYESDSEFDDDGEWSLSEEEDTIVESVRESAGEEHEVVISMEDDDFDGNSYYVDMSEGLQPLRSESEMEISLPKKNADMKKDWLYEKHYLYEDESIESGLTMVSSDMDSEDSAMSEGDSIDELNDLSLTDGHLHLSTVQSKGETSAVMIEPDEDDFEDCLEDLSFSLDDEEDMWCTPSETNETPSLSRSNVLSRLFYTLCSPKERNIPAPMSNEELTKILYNPVYLSALLTILAHNTSPKKELDMARRYQYGYYQDAMPIIES